MNSDKKYGLVFSGGGAKGAYQIGAWKALKELGITNNIAGVAGTSIGGVNLALYATSDVLKSEVLWKSFKGTDFIEEDDNGFDISKEGDGIFSRTALLKILDNNVDYSKISQSDIPYYVTVCYNDSDKNPQKEYVKLNGKNPAEIRAYILATTAVPIVYDNVIINGRAYYDGGIKDNNPIKPLYDEDFDNIILISNNNEYKSKAAKYPNAKVYEIVPSASLDMDTLIGTADLIASHAVYRMRLGYLDAKAFMTAYINGTDVPDMSSHHMLAMQDMKMQQLSDNTNRDMNNINSILKKYGIDDLM